MDQCLGCVPRHETISRPQVYENATPNHPKKKARSNPRMILQVSQRGHDVLLLARPPTRAAHYKLIELHFTTHASITPTALEFSRNDVLRSSVEWTVKQFWSTSDQVVCTADKYYSDQEYNLRSLLTSEPKTYTSKYNIKSVSYTHLTLPTIYSV